MLFLRNGIGPRSMFTPLDLFDPQDYMDQDRELVLSGFGPTTAGGASGTLNWTFMKITNANTTYTAFQEPGKTFNGMKLQALVRVSGGGGVGLPGDSGGTAWGTETEPPTVVGVTSSSNGTTQSNFARSKDRVYDRQPDRRLPVRQLRGPLLLQVSASDARLDAE